MLRESPAQKMYLAFQRFHYPSMEKLTLISPTVYPSKGTRPGYVYSEKDWNPITEEEAIQNPSNGYRASKTFAEKAAWDFVETEKPNFNIVTVCSVNGCSRAEAITHSTSVTRRLS